MRGLQREATVLEGIRFAERTVLRSRALDMVREAPRPAAVLARRVLGIRSAPAGLAERLLRELLAGEPRLRVDEAQVWRWRSSPWETDGDPPLASVPFAVVDVETTGTGAVRVGRVVEIAIVEVRHGRVASEFASLVNPGVPLDPWVRSLTGITDRMVADAPRFAELADLLRDRLEGRVFAAHNASFDFRHVSEEMRRARAIVPEGPRLCTLRFARRLRPDLPRHSLDQVAASYGIEIAERHRAKGDALATAQLLLRLLEDAEHAGVTGWKKLERWLRGPRPRGKEAREGRGAC